MIRNLLSMLTLAALVGGVLARPAAAGLNEGDPTPDFNKTDLDGNPHTLFQYRGKVVVLFLLGYN